MSKRSITLGNMYNEGKGVKQDFTEAVLWFRKAAEQGDVKAQHNLGTMYNEGKGAKQDFTDAVLWFCKAAEQGDVKAQHNLGTMYNESKRSIISAPCTMKARV